MAVQMRDGLIVEAVGYCNGGWDDALRARHAVEAPMLRPMGDRPMSTVHAPTLTAAARPRERDRVGSEHLRTGRGDRAGAAAAALICSTS